MSHENVFESFNGVKQSLWYNYKFKKAQKLKTVYAANILGHLQSSSSLGYCQAIHSNAYSSLEKKVPRL